MIEKELRNIVKAAASEYYKNILEKRKKSEYIHVSGKVIGEEELLNVIDASLDMWLTAGRFNFAFESEFAKLIGRKYAITVNSGSSANLVAFSALTSPLLKDRRLKKGDEVITVAAGFPTTLNPVLLYGLVPVFLDCTIPEYNIDASVLEESITPKTKAIFVAHTLGNPYDLGDIKEVAKKHNLWLIEDTCDALGAEYDGKKAGTFGDLATFSFYPAHHITMGEGGAVATSDPLLYRIIKSFRDWGRDCQCPPGCDNSCGKRFTQKLGNLPFGYDHKYTYSHIGFNLKITDFQAAIGLAQLKKLPIFLQKRRDNAKYLLEKLSDLREFLILPEESKKGKSAWFGFLITLRNNLSLKRNDLISYLENNNVGTRLLFAGNILRQPMLIDHEFSFRIGKDKTLYSSSDLNETLYSKLPNTEIIMNKTFWIGIYPGLEKCDLDKISEVMHEYFKRN